MSGFVSLNTKMTVRTELFGCGVIDVSYLNLTEMLCLKAEVKKIQQNQTTYQTFSRNKQTYIFYSSNKKIIY